MKVLVCEPHAEVRALVGRVVERLGHEAVYPTGRRGRALPEEVDVLLLEPADPNALAVAESIRARHAGLPLVCVSILPESERFEHLQPLAYLVKPFALADLERALHAAAESGAASIAAPAARRVWRDGARRRGALVVPRQGRRERP